MQTFNKRGTKKFKKEQNKKWGKKGEDEDALTNKAMCFLPEISGAHPDLKTHHYGARSTGVTHEAFWQEIPGFPKFRILHFIFLVQK